MKLALLTLLAILGSGLAFADLLAVAAATEPALISPAMEMRRLPKVADLGPRAPLAETGDIGWALPATWEQPSSQFDPLAAGDGMPALAPPYHAPIPLNQLDDQVWSDGAGSWFPYQFSNASHDQWTLDFLARAYFLDDQRVEWSGMERTFGAEGALRPQYHYQSGDWIAGVVGDFYLNQPFDRNMYVDGPERESYLSNFRPDIFQISNLYLSLQCEDWYFAAGKIETPFGRTYFPLFTNSRIDAPFIRTEAIRWRETGLLARYHRDVWVWDVALTNGGVDQDTNSSKAIVSRLGMDFADASIGVSCKYQDGIGSETQKTYNNHIGADFMIQRGRFRLSGEVLYDQYGLRRPGLNPDDIFWEHSIYYRDVNKAPYAPCEGWGYYANLDYLGNRWTTTLNYGEYHPDQLGDPQQDIVNRRGLIKAAFRINRVLQSYTATIIENGGYIAQDNRPRLPFMIVTGFQANF